jgi:hypothetical protein
MTQDKNEKPPTGVCKTPHHATETWIERTNEDDGVREEMPPGYVHKMQPDVAWMKRQAQRISERKRRIDGGGDTGPYDPSRK